MFNKLQIRRAAVSLALVMSLGMTPVCAAETMPETELAEDLQQEGPASTEGAENTVDAGKGRCFEALLTGQMLDAMRSYISVQTGGTDDIAWVKNAAVHFSMEPNDMGSVNLQVQADFNETELYHLTCSVDAKGGRVYLICPELKDQAVVIPFADLFQSAEAQISSQSSSGKKKLIKEASGMAQPAMQIFSDYLAVVQKYVETSGGIMSITAGSLSEEVNTTTFSFSSEALSQMIPEILQKLSEDERIRKAVTSRLTDRFLKLASREFGIDQIPETDELWTLVSGFLSSAAKMDYSKIYGVDITVGFDRSGAPAHLSVSAGQGSMSAELARIDLITDGADHSMEVRIGAVLSGLAGFGTLQSCGGVLQGSVEDGYLHESVSVNADGVTTPVLKLSQIDLQELVKGRLRGDVTVLPDAKAYTCSFYVADDGIQRADYSVNGDPWMEFTLQYSVVDEVEIDSIDTENAFTVTTREEFAEYMRDASAIRMLEKLASAGVPQEYVDKLTDGEAATESSRENKVELSEQTN